MKNKANLIQIFALIFGLLVTVALISATLLTRFYDGAFLPPLIREVVDFCTIPVVIMVFLGTAYTMVKGK